MSSETQLTTKYTDISAFVKTLDDNAPPVTPCKLCNSKYKKDAEEYYDKSGVISAVTRFLKDKGEDISNTAVTNHLNNHYGKVQRHADLREFSSELQKWASLSRDESSMYNRCIEALDMKWNNLMAESSRLDPSESRKNIELCLKISQQITAYKEQLKNLELEKRPVEIFIDTLNQIIRVKLEDIKNPEVRRALEDVVQQLSREVEKVPDND